MTMKTEDENEPAKRKLTPLDYLLVVLFLLYLIGILMLIYK